MSWSDVERIRLDRDSEDPSGHVDLLLTIRSDAPSLVGASGYEQERVSFDPPQLTVPLWGVPEKRAREIVQAFYTGEIN